MREALGLLTVLGGPRTPTPRALRWVPAVGAALGALVGLGWWGAAHGFSPFLAASLAVLADLALTGMLHFDGLADTADGLLPHADPDRRLAVMRAPDVGAFGVAAVGAVLLVRTAALTGQPADIPLLIGIWCASRTVAAVAPAVLPYARDEGMASALLPARPQWFVALALVPAAALAALGAGPQGVLAVAGAVAGSAAVLALAYRRIGGFTGDVLGAAIVVGETVALVIAAAGR